MENYGVKRVFWHASLGREDSTAQEWPLAPYSGIVLSLFKYFAKLARNDVDQQCTTVSQPSTSSEILARPNFQVCSTDLRLSRRPRSCSIPVERPSSLAFYFVDFGCGRTCNTFASDAAQRCRIRRRIAVVVRSSRLLQAKCGQRRCGVHGETWAGTPNRRAILAARRRRKKEQRVMLLAMRSFLRSSVLMQR